MALKMIGGKELYVLEGNTERNEFRIKTTDDVYKDNMIAFAWKLSIGFTFPGMYTTEEAAQEMIDPICTLFRDIEGRMLL